MVIVGCESESDDTASLSLMGESAELFQNGVAAWSRGDRTLRLRIGDGKVLQAGGNIDALIITSSGVGYIPAELRACDKCSPCAEDAEEESDAGGGVDGARNGICLFGMFFTFHG